MPLIDSPNPKPRRVKLTLRLDEPLARTVHRYAEFIHATNEYVISHALNYFFERDSDFKQWIASHPSGQSRNRSGSDKPARTGLDAKHQASSTSSIQETQP
jgi:hypothetical protein